MHLDDGKDGQMALRTQEDCNNQVIGWLRRHSCSLMDYIESFNGRLRDECLNSSWFESLDDARRAVQAWRTDYNDVRPRGSGDLYETTTTQSACHRQSYRVYGL